MSVRDISVEEFAVRRNGEPDFVVLDVRELDEWAAARIEGATHIPMRDLPARLDELKRGAPTAVLCHHGGRSERAAAYLVANGFADVVNVAGGIDAYAERVDTQVGRY